MHRHHARADRALQYHSDPSRFLRAPIWPDDPRAALYVAAASSARAGETPSALLGISDRTARLWGARARARGWTPDAPPPVPFWPLPVAVAAAALPVAAKVAVAAAWRSRKARGDGLGEALAALEATAGADLARALDVDPRTGTRARAAAIAWHRSPDPAAWTARSGTIAPLPVDQTSDRSRVCAKEPTMDPNPKRNVIPFPSPDAARSSISAKAAALGVEIGGIFREELRKVKAVPLARESAWAPAWQDLAFALLETADVLGAPPEGIVDAARDLGRATIVAFIGDAWVRDRRWPAAALWNGARRWIPDALPRKISPAAAAVSAAVVVYSCSVCGYGAVQRPDTGPVRRVCSGACGCETDWRART